jgi:uncharacterized protein (PEP-CTERM system associated)
MIKLKKKTTGIMSVFFTVACTVSLAIAGDAKITPKIDSTINIYNTKIGDGESVSNEAIVILPSVLSTYSAKLVQASFAISHTRVEQNNEIDGANKNFTDLRYNSAFSLIEKAMTLTFSGAQNYRVINSQENIVDDKLLFPGDLTKSRNNAARLNFSIPNPKYLGFTLQSSISEIKTDESLDGPSGLDTQNLSMSTRLFNGNYTKNYNFDLSAQYSKSDRTEGQDFSSSTLFGRIGFAITNTFAWIITGNSENYGVDETILSSRSNLDTISYGTGLGWIPTGEQSILLIYNRLEESNTETDFVGVDVNWALSNRTAFNFNYGKRFFGDAYSVNFRHAARSLRTSLSYTEEMTTFGLLGNSQNDSNGLFVCEFGSTDLVDCFQPESLDYELQAGEEFRVATDIDSDISEELLLRKTGRFNIGYDRRKLKASITASYTKTEYLESDRVQKTHNLVLNLTYALGRKTDISLTSNLSKRQFDELSDEDTSNSLSLEFKRAINNKTELTSSVRLLDRESDDASRDLTDKRFTLGLKYTF